MAQYREQLIRYTEHKILEVERPNDVGLGLDTEFDSPKFPMIVFNMSTSLSDDSLFQLKSDLFSIWPRYREVIPFINEYRSVDFKSMVEQLMDQGNNFAKYVNLLLYFIVDTSDFNSKDDFLNKLKEIYAIKEQMSGFAEPKCVLFLLFTANNPESNEIREVIRSLYTDDRYGLDLVVVVGNQLTNAAFVSDNRERIRELVTIVLLSNGGGTQGVNKLTLNNDFKIVTVSANHQEKPYSDIAKVIITRIFSRIQDLIRNNNPTFDEAEYLQKIGINSVTHCFDLFEKHMSGSILDEVALYYFPMKESGRNIDLNYSTYDDFNEMTFGTLDAYLKEQICSSAFFDHNKKERIKEEYRAYLYSVFTLWDLKAMQGRVDQLNRKYVDGVQMVDRAGMSIMEVFESKYKSGICSSPEFCSVFFDVIQKLCDDAQLYSDALNELINDIGALQHVKDATVRDFYQQITDEFIRDNPKVFEDLLKVDILQNQNFEDEFIKKVKNLIERIITSKIQIFSLPYVQELSVRLKATTTVAVVTAITTGINDANNQNVYYRPISGTSGDLRSVFGSPVLLINQNGELKNIKETEDYSIINTMSDSFVEKIDVLRLQEGNI